MTTTVKETEEGLGFGALGLAKPLVAAVTALGYEEPTPIQREAIPLLLEGRDLLGQAGTGTGKTAAFALPMLDRLTRDTAGSGGARSGKNRYSSVRALVLVPTRELAMQVAEAVHKYSKGLRLHVVPLYGGAPMDQQVRALQRGAEVVVATPGRALDHLRRQTLDLSALQVLVLDEADEMLDMGFAEDIDAILEGTPETRQTALFAATFAPRIMAITGRHLKDPARVTIAREKRAPGKMPRVRQVAYIVGRPQKTTALGRILDFEAPKSAIVFCRTRLEVDELTDTLNAHGYGAQALHGGMVQKQRDRVMTLFRNEQAEILVATDVAARGLDIDHVSHVINYDVPTAPEVYVHRIGRTGRIGREGVAITLANPREHRFLRSVEALTKQKIDVLNLPSLADLRARRLEATRDLLREQLVAGGLEDVRAIVESLVQDFDVLDIAAAAVKMVHDAEEGGIPIPERKPPSPESFTGGPPARERHPGSTARAGSPPSAWRPWPPKDSSGPGGAHRGGPKPGKQGGKPGRDRRP
jgi:ATP-dependent RNA helicase DeaD